MNKHAKRIQEAFKRQVEENPTAVLATVSGAAYALAQLMNANTGRVNSKTHRREVARREVMTYDTRGRRK